MAQFEPLSGRSDARFVAGRYDVRDWEVRTAVDREPVGRVHDVLLSETGRTRYLDVDLDGGRHVLVPSGETHVDPDAHVVLLPGLDRAGLDTLPAYDHVPGHITPEYARSLAAAHDHVYRDEHYYDRADYGATWTGIESAPGDTVARLDALEDVEVARDDPDPRGWEVVDAADHHLGRVNNLIGDTAAMKVRYLSVALDDERAGKRRSVLIPTGHVDLDPGREHVVVRGLEGEQLADIPAWDGGPIGRAYEREITQRYDQAYAGPREYEHPRYQSRSLDAAPRRPERD